MVKIAPGIYAIDSFSSETTSYWVDLNRGTCSCPHYTNRLAGTGKDCKHLTACRAERFAGIAEKAKALPQSELEALLPIYEERLQLEIAIAIRSEIQARQQAESRDAQLKQIFA